MIAAYEEEERKKRESIMAHTGGVEAVKKKPSKGGKGKGKVKPQHVTKTVNKIEVEKTLEPSSWQRPYKDGEAKPLVRGREESFKLIRGKVDELNRRRREEERLGEVEILFEDAV